MSDLPAPLVPAEVDLRDFGWMPVDIGRLFGSEFHARSSDMVWRTGVTLWLKAYHQVPASSIPDDDVAMARLAELGRDLKTWRRIKAEVLRGWVKCSDGRFYHPVVAEKALEAWIEKLVQRKSSAAGNAKRYQLKFDPKPFDVAIATNLERLAGLNPNSRTLTKRAPKAKAQSDAPDDLPAGDDPSPTGMPDSSHRDAGEVSSGDQKAPSGIARDPTLQGHIPPEPPSGSLPPEGDAPGEAPEKAKPKTGRGSRQASHVPEDWNPSAQDRAYAEGQGLTPDEIDRRAEEFRDYWLAKSGPDALKRDWSAAWRTWVRREIRGQHRSPSMLLPINGGRHPHAPNGASPSRPASGSASAMAGMDAYPAKRRQEGH
jgi:hypothetical protein